MDVDKDDKWKLGGDHAKVGEVFIDVVFYKQVSFNEELENHGRMVECCDSRKTR